MFSGPSWMRMEVESTVLVEFSTTLLAFAKFSALIEKAQNLEPAEAKENCIEDKETPLYASAGVCGMLKACCARPHTPQALLKALLTEDCGSCPSTIPLMVCCPSVSISGSNSAPDTCTSSPASRRRLVELALGLFCCTAVFNASTEVIRT